MEERKEEITFASFKGLGYVSMVKGVPLFPLLILCFLGIAGTFLLMFIFGLPGILWLFLCAAALLGMKTVCESDNKAMERAHWAIKAIALRFRKKSSILIISPNKIGSKHERFRKKLTKIHRSR